jgi:hypothetical protein
VEHWRLGRDESFARELVVPVAHGAEQLARRGGSRRALLDASELLLAAGEADAAADAARLASRLVSHVGDEPADEGWRAGDELAVSLDRASPTWAWSTPDAGHDRLATAAFLERARGQLVREVEDGVALCSHVPDTWLGRGIEVHDAPTRLGRISFAIRWHGDRPALLWELDAHPGVGETSVRVPGLDPTWSSGERRGDALLAPVAAPGTPVRLKRR